MEQMMREAEEEATRQYEASRARAEAADRQAFEARVSATDDARLHLIASLIRCVARVRTTDDALLHLIASDCLPHQVRREAEDQANALLEAARKEAELAPLAGVFEGQRYSDCL